MVIAFIANNIAQVRRIVATAKGARLDVVHLSVAFRDNPIAGGGDDAIIPTLVFRHVRLGKLASFWVGCLGFPETAGRCFRRAFPHLRPS